MQPVDPRRSDEVGAALVALATERFGGTVELLAPALALGDGLDSHIHAATLVGAALPDAWRGPLVVRLLPTVDRVDQAHDEAAVQCWCAAQGYPVPDVLAVIDPGAGFGRPAQIMTRAPGVTVLDAIRSRPWRAFDSVDRLAALHRRLHALATDGWPVSTDPTVLVDKRLGLPRRVVVDGAPPGFESTLEAIAAVVPIAAGGPPVVCHGDFHPLNVVVDGSDATVLDWTDAGLGPREADVARTRLLFGLVAVATSRRAERMILGRVGPVLARRYLRAYTRGVRLDERRMLAWEALHALHGWAQVHTLHAGGFDGSSSADAAQVPPELVDVLRAHVERALTVLQ